MIPDNWYLILNVILALVISMSHWEELLQSVSDFILSKHCRYRSREIRGVNRSEKLWEIQNYPSPGQPFNHHWVKSKTICHFSRHFDAFLNGFWFYSNMAGWLTWQWVFLNFSQISGLLTPLGMHPQWFETTIWNRYEWFLLLWYVYYRVIKFWQIK